MDIGTEELSHLEVVGTLARMHLKPLKARRSAAGGGVALFNSVGDAGTADYLKNHRRTRRGLPQLYRRRGKGQNRL
jgi:Mn-containing catalase